MYYFKQYLFLILFSTTLVFNQAIAFESIFSQAELKREIENKVIALISLDVEITQIKSIDTKDANQGWSNRARKNIISTLKRLLSNPDADLPRLNERAIVENPQALQIIALQSIINLSILGHVQSPLPSKQQFDWSQGPDIRRLSSYVEADLGLFLFVRAGFETDLSEPQYQAGFVSLVDLNNGNTVWFDQDTQIDGDFRDTSGAIIALKALMKNFPTIDYTGK